MFSLFIRSFIFWLYSTISIVLYSFVCVASAPLSLEKRHAVIRVYLRAYFFVLHKVCRINYKVEGLENIPQKPAVILSKHQSTLETFFLPLIFYAPSVIVKRELFWVPFFGWALMLAGPIPINRQAKQNATAQILEKGQEMLKQGRWVLLFPEGTRVPYGKVGHYRLGGARLAVAASVPVVPIAHDAGKVWPRRRFIKRPGTVHIVIGKPISTIGKTPEQVLEETKNWIENTIKELPKD